MPIYEKPANIHAFSGAHGTGKTTSVNALAEKMHRRYPDGMDIGVITERARECPYPVLSCKADSPSAEAQLWIFSSQVNAELDAALKYDVVISDRTVIDCIAYTIYFQHACLADAMIEMAAQHVHHYADIVFKCIGANPWQLPDGFRDMNAGVRQSIETIMLNLYEELDMHVIMA